MLVLLAREGYLFPCVYYKESYLVFHPTHDCFIAQLIKSLTAKYYLSKIYVSDSLDYNKLYSAVPKNLEIEWIKCKEFIEFENLRIPSHSSACLGVLSKIMNHLNFALSSDSNALGRLSGHKIIYKSNKEFIYLKDYSLKYLDVFSSFSENSLYYCNFNGKYLFDFINYTITAKGKNKLKGWISCPFASKEYIINRQSIQNRILESLDHIRFLLRHCRIQKIEIGLDFIKILNMINAAFKLESYVKYLIKIENKDIYKPILEYIQMIEGKDEIKEGVDKDLDALRNLKSRVPGFLSNICRKMASRYSNKISLVYFPQLGYYVECEGIIGKPEFNIGEMKYYKTLETDYLDSTLGDIETKIEIRTMKLKNKIWEKISSCNFEFLFEFISEVDAIQSLAKFKEINDCKAPIFTTKPVISIDPKEKEETSKEKNQPVFTEMKKFYLSSKILIDSETPHMKMIAQIILLSQIGCFLPFKRIMLPIFENIIIKPQFNESIRNQKIIKKELEKLSETIKISNNETIVIYERIGQNIKLKDKLNLLFALNKVMKSKMYMISLEMRFDDKTIEVIKKQGIEILKDEEKKYNKKTYNLEKYDSILEDFSSSFVREVKSVEEKINDSPEMKNIESINSSESKKSGMRKMK